MELRDYWRILVQRGWIVLIAGLLTAGSAYMWSAAQPREYRASAVLIVRADTLEWGRLQASKQVLSNYATIIRSENTAFRVVDALRLDVNPYRVLERVTVMPDPNQLIMQIDVTDRDPQLAAQIANGFADEFHQQIDAANQMQRREDRVEVDVIQRAGQGTLVAPRPAFNAMAGALLGILLGGFIVLALELLDNTIKTQEDIERYVGKDLMLLGQLPPGQPDLAPYRQQHKKSVWQSGAARLRRGM
jgi:capsular polysaccharide biosynthesis protein